MSPVGVIGQTITVPTFEGEFTIWCEAPGRGKYHAFQRRPLQPSIWIVVKRDTGMGRDKWVEA